LTTCRKERRRDALQRFGGDVAGQDDGRHRIAQNVRQILRQRQAAGAAVQVEIRQQQIGRAASPLAQASASCALAWR
jgi:hypothetical protein